MIFTAYFPHQNSVPETHKESQELWYTFLSPALGRQRMVDLWGSLASQLALTGETQASEGDVSENKGDSA